LHLWPLSSYFFGFGEITSNRKLIMTKYLSPQSLSIHPNLIIDKLLMTADRYDELLNFWRGGGMYGLYNWHAIVAEKR
jgi:hypothetical protein